MSWLADLALQSTIGRGCLASEQQCIAATLKDPIALQMHRSARSFEFRKPAIRGAVKSMLYLFFSKQLLAAMSAFARIGDIIRSCSDKSLSRRRVPEDLPALPESFHTMVGSTTFSNSKQRNSSEEEEASQFWRQASDVTLGGPCNT
jgi:hypothetical protein